MFVDRVRIWAKAGDGGSGACSFYREKFMPKGGPDGGDGGKGADVVLVVNPHLNNLLHLRFKPHHFAPHGKAGSGRLKTGGSGKEYQIEVPPGTSIYQLETTEENFERAADESTRQLVVDLTEPNTRYILCHGGRGGKGNAHFKSSVNQAPTKYQPGIPGEKGQYIFELKSIADAGLVGFPNAGKSSILGMLSAAQPKVAAYPFTTLQPMVGVIEFKGYNRITMADIPGLIEGAHQGVGLGHDFLKHIERCKLLVFVIDMAGSEGREPWSDYAQLRQELKFYQPQLAERDHFIIANKMDLPEAAEKLKLFKKKARVPVIPTSTLTGQGKEEILQTLESFKTKWDKENDKENADRA